MEITNKHKKELFSYLLTSLGDYHQNQKAARPANTVHSYLMVYVTFEAHLNNGPLLWHRKSNVGLIYKAVEEKKSLLN